MANEITIGERRGSNVQALFLFPVATPATYGSTSTKVVPTPSAGLPEWASPVFSQAEKNNLDSGDAAFQIVNIGIEGISSAEILVRLRAIYVARKAVAAALYLVRYERIGERFDES